MAVTAVRSLTPSQQAAQSRRAPVVPLCRFNVAWCILLLIATVVASSATPTHSPHSVLDSISAVHPRVEHGGNRQPPQPTKTVVSQGDIFNVKDYGAKGDGTTDDSSAISATIVAALSYASTAPSLNATVLFPAGTYLTTQTFAFTPTNEDISITLTGESSDVDADSESILESHNYDLFEWSSMNTLQIQNMQIINVDSLATSTAIDVSQIDQLVVVSVNITGFDTAVYANQVNSISVDQFEYSFVATNPKYPGNAFVLHSVGSESGGPSFSLTNSKLYSNGPLFHPYWHSVAVHLMNSSQISIDSVLFDGFHHAIWFDLSKTQPIFNAGGELNSVSFTNCDTPIYVIDDAPTISLQQCTFYNSSQIDVFILHEGQVPVCLLVEGCQFTSLPLSIPPGGAISSSGAANLTVRGNIFTSYEAAASIQFSADNFVIDSNTFANNFQPMVLDGSRFNVTNNVCTNSRFSSLINCELEDCTVSNNQNC